MNEQLPDPMQQITGQVRSLFYLVDEPATTLTIQADGKTITVRAAGQVALEGCDAWFCWRLSVTRIGGRLSHRPSV